MQAQATGQSEPQLDPSADPHDTIIALLRDAEPLRAAHDLSELNISPVDAGVSAAASAAPPINPASRATPSNDMVPFEIVAPRNNNLRIDQPRSPRVRRGRGITRFVLTVCAGVAATIGWQAYGDDAIQRAATLVPQLLGSAPAQATSVADNVTPVQATAAEPTAEPAQAVPAPAAPSPGEQPATAAVAPPAPAVSTPAQAAIPVEVTQSIEAMTREIASLKQTIEQLKDGQEKLSRDLAKAVEQEQRKKTAATQAPKPPTNQPSPPQQRVSSPQPLPQAAAAPRSSAPYYPTPQPYYAQGAAPRDVYIPPPPRTQLPPEPGYVTTPRPPRPLP
jgi:hypothetical protein